MKWAFGVAAIALLSCSGHVETGSGGAATTSSSAATGTGGAGGRSGQGGNTAGNGGGGGTVNRTYLCDPGNGPAFPEHAAPGSPPCAPYYCVHLDDPALFKCCDPQTDDRCKDFYCVIYGRGPYPASNLPTGLGGGDVVSCSLPNWCVSDGEYYSCCQPPACCDSLNNDGC